MLSGPITSRFFHGKRYGVRLSVKVGLGLPGLYLWSGKPRLVRLQSRPSLVVVPKARAMARFSVGGSVFAILLPPLSWFCPQALYCLPAPWLAPDCYSPAGTLLPGGSARLWILSDCRAPGQLRPVVVLHRLRGCRQRLG